MVDRATLVAVTPSDLIENLAVPLRRFWTGDSFEDSTLIGMNIWLLGKKYGPFRESEMMDRWGEYQTFVRDFHSRLWFTYRSGFEPISPTAYTSDAGWGCMLRSGQMLLGQTLVRHILTDEWQLGHNIREITEKYSQILSWFLDHKDVHTAPFSIHQIASQGQKHDKAIGEWFGPSTIAAVLKTLVQQYRPYGMNAYVAQDGVIYKNQVLNLCYSDPDPSKNELNIFHGILILIPLRLGLESMNEIYQPALRKCFEYPYSVGIAGGRPNSSLYFLAIDDANQLYYLDPHVIRPTIEIKSYKEYEEHEWSSYHCDDFRRIDITKIDPSLLLGFYCQNLEQLNDFFVSVQNDNSQFAPIFSVAEEAPIYADDVNLYDVDDEEDANLGMDDDGELV